MFSAHAGTMTCYRGATRCRKHCGNRNQQSGTAFEMDNAIAVPRLKEVVITIQTEIIPSLGLARTVDNAVLDFTALHESSATGRKDATRAMDHLYQRLMASRQIGSRSRSKSIEVTPPSTSSPLSSYANLQPPGDSERFHKLLPSLPSTMESPSSILQRALHNRSQIVDKHSETARRASPRSESHQSPEIWALKEANLQGQHAEQDSFVPRPLSHLT